MITIRRLRRFIKVLFLLTITWVTTIQSFSSTPSSSSSSSTSSSPPFSQKQGNINDINNNKKKKDDNSIRLISWNLLAPIFSHPQKYPWCSSEFLSWNYREKLILSELDRMDADIVCLQEVQTDHWSSFLMKLEHRYEGILQNVTNHHPVTNAILLRKNQFQVLRKESRSRALILVLQQERRQQSTTTGSDHDQSPLYLANVHLQAGMEDDETRICQLKSLLKRLNTQTKVENRNKSKDPTTTTAISSSSSCVIVGDFNMLPSNPVYRWLSHKNHVNADIHGQSEQPKVHMHDYGTGQQLRVKFPSTGQHMELLPLKDVYCDIPPTLASSSSSSSSDDSDYNERQRRQQQQCIQKTYCGGSVLDYIWTNQGQNSIDVSKTMVFHPQAFHAEPQPWPSQHYPSDHIPVGVEFSWD